MYGQGPGLQPRNLCLSLLLLHKGPLRIVGVGICEASKQWFKSQRLLESGIRACALSTPCAPAPLPLPALLCFWVGSISEVWFWIERCQVSFSSCFKKQNKTSISQ